MSTYNLLQLSNRILRESNRDSSQFQNDVVNSIVSAIIEIEDLKLWVNEKEIVLNTVPNQSYVLLPADFRSVQLLRLNIGGVYYTQTNGFEGIPYERMMNDYLSVDTIGQPSLYALYGNKIYFFPTPANVYELYLSYQYGDAVYPSNLTDTSVFFQPKTMDLVRLKALEIFYRDILQDDESSARSNMAFQNKLNTLYRQNQRTERLILEI